MSSSVLRLANRTCTFTIITRIVDDYIPDILTNDYANYMFYKSVTIIAIFVDLFLCREECF